MFRILFVCTGNTCRSPMAETLLRHKIQTMHKTDQIMVLSAGVAAGGDTASANARQAMRSRGLNLDEHVPRQLSSALVEAADLILTMTQGHKRAVLGIAPTADGKTFTLAEFAGQAGDVADPFGGSATDYEDCARQVEALLSISWEKIVEMAGNKG